MINITFPNGTVKQYETNSITGSEIANDISISLGKEAYVIKVNGELKDLTALIQNDAEIEILTAKDSATLDVIRHDTAHITAQAVKELFPDAQPTIGPAIENGYFYDFAKNTPFTLDDLVLIEERMMEIVQRNEAIIRHVWDRKKAIEFFKSRGENFKIEIIEDLPKNEEITIYQQGDFFDLCRGPHATSTGKVKFFKLTKLAGAYWRGDSTKSMLQRIYGTAWSSQKQLDDYLMMLAEAEKRDHRKIGKELDLFHFQQEAQGMPFWHEKGWSIYLTIEHYIRNKIRLDCYKEVKTPMLVDRTLWEQSGHWEMYQENMFTINSDDKILALKPMNCPCHVQIFKSGIKSYRDLPIRMAEFGSCHRYEPSGALHGLMRVRKFVQDDAHIFCTEDQITAETIQFCQLLIKIYNDFGFSDIKVKFAAKPEKSVGSDQIWEKAEKALHDGVIATGLSFELNPGEGAFYGPKLEFVLRDAIGRDWQCGTFQVDFVLPERLDASYIDAHGLKQRPVMLHRAIIGSFERFIGILIEQYAGKFPLWLSPIQVAIATITNDSDEYARIIYKKLVANGIRALLDISSEKVNYKLRMLLGQKIPIIAVIGKQEVQNNTVSLRKIDSIEQVSISSDELIKMILSENAKYLS